MRIEQLECLVDIAQTKSMNKTAERMFVSPPAVSKSIKQLERELDVQLLVRTSMGVVLTELGEIVVEHAQNILKEELLIKKVIAIKQQKELYDKTFYVRICSTSAIINIVLPDVMAKFAQMNIKIIPRIYMVDSLRELFAEVEKGTYDIGLLTYNEEELVRKFVPYQQTLDMELLGRDEQVVVANRALQHMEQAAYTMEDVYKHFCSIFSIIPIDERLYHANKLHVLCSNDVEFHRALIKKVDAYVIMPKLAYQHFFSGNSYMALPLACEPIRMLHASVYRKDASSDIHKMSSLIRAGML